MEYAGMKPSSIYPDGLSEEKFISCIGSIIMSALNLQTQQIYFICLGL
jgi:hypothetical protein